MKKLLLILLLLSLVTFPLISCSRVQEPDKGALKTIKLKKLDSIPIEYGSLVSITANPEFPRWAQLWFEDDDRTIRMVHIGFAENRVSEKVIIIPRY